MIGIILTTAIIISPAPAQPASAVQIVNISAAQQARTIPAPWRPFTECISERESGYGRTSDTRAAYKAANPTSSAQGRYQFLDASGWRHGGAWNVWKRLIRHGYDKATASRVRNRLMSTPIKEWKPVYQDIAYAETLLSGNGKGWRHWHLAGSRCNNLIPR
jgi:hypothetical protein